MARYVKRSSDNQVSPKEMHHDMQVYPIISDGPALTNDYTPKRSPRSNADENVTRSVKGGISKRDVPRDNGPLNGGPLHNAPRVGGPIMQEGTSPAGDMPWEQQSSTANHGGFWEKRAKHNGVKH